MFTMKVNMKITKILQRAAAVLTALCLASALLTGCAEKEVSDPADLTYYSPYSHAFGSVIKAEIVFKSYGTVKLDLYPDVAPVTVQNFVDLANSGFYDGLTIHRVVPGFVIQGGDPRGDGFGLPDQTKIKGEFASNGVANEISHVRGVISMARSSNSYDSATSQFFIMLDDKTQVGYLNGNYAAFGYVTEGMDVVDKIAEVEIVEGSDRPQKTITIESVKIVDGTASTADTKTTESTSTSTSSAPASPIDPANRSFYSPYNHDFGSVIKAEMVFKDYGTVKLELYPDAAPISVQNFVDLVSSGFYDGLTIHRIVPGFVIQGGDPTGTGYGQPDQKKIKGEFAANGIVNEISHVRGVLSMARAGNSYDSATSQFFIMHADSTYLDGNYAAFGRVTEGMDVIDAIAAVEIGVNDRPVETIIIESVKIVTD